MVQVTVVTAIAHGSITTAPVTAVITPAMIAVMVHIPTATTPPQRNTPHTAVPSIRSAVIVPPVIPMLGQNLMKVMISPTVHGRNTTTVNTVGLYPARTADTAVTNTTAIRSATAHGNQTVLPSILGR